MPRKKIGSIHTAKNGARYKITAKGARFVSSGKKKAKRRGGGLIGDAIRGTGQVIRGAVRVGARAVRSRARKVTSRVKKMATKKNVRRVARGQAKRIWRTSTPGQVTALVRGNIGRAKTGVKVAKTGVKAINYLKKQGGGVRTGGKVRRKRVKR